MKFDLNAPCWCGSEKKYKECHLGRSTESKLPYPAIRQIMRKEFEAKKCLHPLASSSACGKISAAHTIQRAGALRNLVDENNHVMTFYPTQLDHNGKPILKNIGWHDASTFRGFCEKHDGKTFYSLEKKPFMGTPDQCFLIGYRALCHELYQKVASARANLQIRNYIDKGQSFDEQQQTQYMFALLLAGVNHSIESLMNKKKIMDKDFLDQDFKNWKSLIVKFNGNISVASTGAPTPTHDFSGTQIQILHDPNTPIQHLFYGVVPTQTGGAVVFLWHSNDYACNDFIDSLRKLSAESLPNILVQFMFVYVENTFFSKSWWVSLSNTQQSYIKSLAGIIFPYHQNISYSNETLISWDITSVEYH